MTRFLTILLLTTACQAGQIQVGCDALSGTDSSEALRTFGQNTVNPDWMRVSFQWAAVETSPGVYNWTQFDRVMAANTVSNYAAGTIGIVPQPKLILNIFRLPAFYKTQTTYIQAECNV